jgi:predicted AAA+ superfamily ATPase
MATASVFCARMVRTNLCKPIARIKSPAYIVFSVRPWRKNITHATLIQPKVYFFDTGLVKGDAGVRFENLVACHLLKQVHWQQDALGKQTDLHYIRTKDGAEAVQLVRDLRHEQDIQGLQVRDAASWLNQLDA